MSDRPDEEKFLEEIDVRLNTWRRLWVGFVWAYFFLGVIGVVCSTLAASSLLKDPWRALLSLGSAVCLAVIGFLRPEPRYKNLVRAWRDLKAARARYLFEDPKRKPLIDALQKCERIATDDESQPATQDPETDKSPLEPTPQEPRV